MVSDKLKRIALHFPEKTQIDFLIRLREDGLRSQTEFFREVIYAYLNNDPNILNFVDSIKLHKKPSSKKENKIKRELIIEGEELIKDFGLSDGEIQNIFDLIEENNKDF